MATTKTKEADAPLLDVVQGQAQPQQAKPAATKSKKGQQVAVAKPQQEVAVAATVSPMQMLADARRDGASPELIKQFMELALQWEANQARKAYNRALALAKSEFVPIKKNRHVGFESKKAGAKDTSYWHEDLAEIERTVVPILSKHGLSYTWEISNAPNEPVTVACILHHEDGHSVKNTPMRGPADGSGNKNSLQALGSTATYLQRYTLKAALGLSVDGADDDGRASGEALPEDRIDDDQALKLQDLIDAVGADRKKFLEYLQIESLGHLPKGRFAEAVRELRAFDDRQKKAANGATK